MKIALWNKLVDKAKSKNDGVYSYQGIKYAVKKGNIGFYWENGVVYQTYGIFSVKIGKCQSYESFKKIKELYKK